MELKLRLVDTYLSPSPKSSQRQEAYSGCPDMTKSSLLGQPRVFAERVRLSARMKKRIPVCRVSRSLLQFFATLIVVISVDAGAEKGRTMVTTMMGMLITQSKRAEEAIVLRRAIGLMIGNEDRKVEGANSLQQCSSSAFKPSPAQSMGMGTRATTQVYLRHSNPTSCPSDY